MATETPAIETDFDDLFSLLYKLEGFDDAEQRHRLTDTLYTLEKYLQDLDIKGGEYWIVWKIVMTKLAYWQEIIKQGSPFLNEFLGLRPVFVESVIYSMKFLIRKCREVLQGGDIIKISKELEAVTPAPGEFFTTYYERVENIKLPPIAILVHSFIKNFVNAVFGMPEIEISSDHRTSYSQLTYALDKSELFNLVQEEYTRNAVEQKEFTLIPVQIYLDTNNDRDIEQFNTAFKKLLETLDFQVLHEFEAKHGSWFRNIILSVKRMITSDEVIERLKKVEHGLEINTINKIQSEIDKNQAEAIAAVLKASENIPRLVTLIGSLLIIKTTNESNEPSLFVRTLTTKEVIYINANPGIINNPPELLKRLQAQEITN